MNIVRIDNGGDPRLADYAGVRDPAWLRQRGLLIVEGRLVVRRLMASGHLRPVSLLLNDAAAHAMADVLAASGTGCDVYVASPEVITAATGFNMHRGCLAVAHRPTRPPLEAVLRNGRLVTILERIVDPDNVGSVFRSAEAFGVDAVLLGPGCSDPFYRKAIRTSSGAALVVPSADAVPWPDALDRVRAAGFLIVATTPAPDATDIGTFARSTAAQDRVAVLLGTEGHGLTDEALARADVRVRIPMAAGVDSLNIATASGIVLQRIDEARRGEGTSGTRRQRRKRE